MARQLPAKKKSSASPKAENALFAPAPADFTRGFYEHLLPADLALFTSEERARMAASIWKLATVRRKGAVNLRIFNPSPRADGWTVDHTVIEIVSDDAPFLVDSVTGALKSRGFTVHIVIHPVIQVKRDDKGKALGLGRVGDEDTVAESFMQIQIDHSLDGALLALVEQDIRAALGDVAAAVGDWDAMRKRMAELTENLTPSKRQADAAEDIAEVRDFLRWLIEDNFTFLGYREVDLKQEGENVTNIKIRAGKGLGILRDDEARMFGGLRDFDKRANPALRQYVRQNHVLFLTKTNAISRVHRMLPMDAVFIRSFDDKGTVIGEKLFVGLFTSKTYAQTPREIPVIRRKIADVAARMKFPGGGHDMRSMTHILNTYPHDELFQITEDELSANALGILQLQERARVALFPRRDPFGRYVTFLVFVPRDRYDSALRIRIQSFLEKAYNGKSLAWHVRLDDSYLARGFATIRLTPDSPHPDAKKLEQELRELCRSWSDRLRDSLVKAHGEAAALVLLRRYGDAFPENYREAVPPARAVQDIRNLERVRLHPSFVADLDDAGGGRVRLKLLQPDRPLSLSEALPLIENMGLKADYMGGPYEVAFKDETSPIYIHEFVGSPARATTVSFDHIKEAFEDALARVWSGEVENDSFNTLTLRVGLDWRAISVLRAFARYLRQLRIPYSHEMMAAAFLAYPQMAQKIYALFYARHNPDLTGNRANRMKTLEQEVLEELATVTSLEDDRIIRRYLNLVQASLRTNYFQMDDKGLPKSYISIKFDSRAVDFMPLPKPLYEIFVYSPQTEAVHLRGGKVARGGIRWSDRRDDFRAEILGLMKAQMVKNSVIVPVGSKGGFIVKRPPVESDKFMAEGIACYRIMMNGLLDITDNRKNGKIVPPKNLVRHDQDDPYLVVAADKGTAKFSDIANGISRDYGFWLDDAFASGGSAGYDHKDMGITARGAWEAVKRHFREMGKDIQTTPFTCIGIGDMSGDVFGNGMLLSKQTQLLAAFDHRHIFCDPNPDAATSFAERKRLFALPRSSWADYNAKLISRGGGIFARSEKSIKLTPEMKKAYGIFSDSLAPNDFILALLKAEVELLYFGGIGTYVKAEDETNDEVGDRATESLRVNGNELRAKIIGEGANLGMTQRGRVEYAQKGGRLNTDAIDNSAGVDTSDHEVNIKILLRPAVDKNKLTLPARDKLLASMTDDVAQLVLRDNYLQTQLLSLVESQAPELLATHVRCMQIMEKSGLLNRAVEYLPNDAEIAERQRLGKGLTRPELAVLMAYAKIWIYHLILDSDLPDDPALRDNLHDYFPAALRKNYAKDIDQHGLKREIAATVVTNDMVNRTGMRIIIAMNEAADPMSVVRSYMLTRDAFGLTELWQSVEALDNIVPAAAQTRLMVTIHAGLTRAMEKFRTDKTSLGNLSASIDANRKGLAQLSDWLAKNAARFDANMLGGFEGMNIPPELAQQAAQFPLLVTALDLIGLAAKHKMKVGDLAGLFFGFEKRLDLGWLTRLAALATVQTPWQREAIGSALASLAGQHLRLTAQLAAKNAKGKKTGVEDWATQNAAKLDRYDTMLAEWHAAGVVDLAMLLLANERLASLNA